MITARATSCLGVLLIALASCTFDEGSNQSRGCDEGCAPGSCYLGFCLQRLDEPAAAIPGAQGGAAGTAPTLQSQGGAASGVSGAAAPATSSGGGGTAASSGGVVMAPGCASGTPAVESCNALDDDCDGMVDEDAALSCYPAGAGGCAVDAVGAYQCVGVCAPGVQACQGGVLGACEGAVQPAAEDCGAAEALDENCDGAVDDGCTCDGNVTQRCYGGPAFSAGAGICRAGTQRCVNGLFGACEGEVTPVTESCANQGSDDDCDRFVDDVFGAGAVCLDFLEQGVCSVGVRVCRSGALACVTPEPENDESSCDGQDEDCDGAVDEDFDLQDDPDNCGGCGVRCASGDLCCDGSCRDPDVDAQHCGGCGRPCGGDAACCGGACVATNTVTNCGRCGNQCGGDMACCGGGCVATNTVTNCGGCGGCTQDQACCAGDCVDPSDGGVACP